MRKVRSMLTAIDALKDVGFEYGYLDRRQSPRIYNNVRDIPEWTDIDDIQQILYMPKKETTNALDDKAEAASTAQDRYGAVPRMQPDSSSR